MPEEQTFKVLHFFPLIGGAYLGTEYLKFHGKNVKNMDKAFSLTGAKKNEAPLIRNRPLTVEYIDETYKDVECHCMTCDESSDDYNIQCAKIDKLIEDNKEYISEADCITSIPPCNSLCQLNRSATSRTGKGNRASQIMIRCVEFAMKSGVESFVFENAPALAQKAGVPLLEQIQDRIKGAGYVTTILKTNSKYHGQGQKRDRTFIYLFKGDKSPKMKWNFDDSGTDKILSDIAESVGKIEYTTEPQNKQQEFLQRPNRTLTDEVYEKADVEYNRWQEVYDLLGEKMGAYLIHFKDKLDTEDKLDAIIEKWESTNWTYDVSDIKKFIIRASKKLQINGGYWGSELVDSWDKRAGNYYVPAINGKSMERFVHPTEKRLLTFREECRLMGIPDDFEIFKKERTSISQNVPAITFASVIEQCYNNWNGDLEKSDNIINFYKIAGIKEPKITYTESSVVSDLIK